MVAGGIATLIPISNPNLSHDSGIFLGRNMYTNAPVYVDTFIRSTSTTKPTCIHLSVQVVGGKSVALKTLTARNIATTGCGAFFIDVER